MSKGISIHSTEDESAAFTSWATDHGQSRSEALRSIIAAATGIEFAVSTSGRHVSPQVKAHRLLQKADLETKRELSYALWDAGFQLHG